MTPSPTRHPPARKRFGQHFLEPAWAEKLVRAIAPEPGSTFLEIGPGRGAITRPLAAAAGLVVAFEIDRDLASRLRSTAPSNLRVVEGDFLDVSAGQVREALADTADLKVRTTTDNESDTRVRTTTDSAADVEVRTPNGIRVAGNLPYNVASPIMFKLVELVADGLPIVDATIMLQREVADRLLASPGTKEYGVLSILMGHTARVERLLQLPAGAFRPAPKVLSTVVRLIFHPPDPPASNLRAFAALTQSIFTRRRKTLGNALAAFSPLPARLIPGVLGITGIDPRRRPETLSIAELVKLSDAAEAVRRGSAVL